MPQAPFVLNKETTSGFASKDEILMATYAHSPVLFWLACFAALLTMIYMFRLMMLVFFGGFKGTYEQEHHLHESPSAMTIPLIILAVLSAIGGLVQFPEMFGGHPFFNEFLSAVVPAEAHEIPNISTVEWGLFGGTVVALIIVFAATRKMFARTSFEGVYTGIKKVMADKWYIDELYDAVIVRPLNALAGILKSGIEKAIDGMVNGVGRFVNYLSRQLRLIQSGQVGNYILFMVLSIVVLFVVFWQQDKIIHFMETIF